MTANDRFCAPYIGERTARIRSEESCWRGIASITRSHDTTPVDSWIPSRRYSSFGTAKTAPRIFHVSHVRDKDYEYRGSTTSYKWLSRRIASRVKITPLITESERGRSSSTQRRYSAGRTERIRPYAKWNSIPSRFNLNEWYSAGRRVGRARRLIDENSR